jgi:[ribosomal protein S5]-alanine N-acetyltransferase
MTLLPGTDFLETERLILRRMDSTDLDFFIAIHADRLVARYIGSGDPRTPADTERWFHDIQDTYRAACLGQLVVIRKADGLRIGRCGLSDAVVEQDPAPGQVRKGWFFSAHAPGDIVVEKIPELGYTFGQEHWGKGYASEAAGAVFGYARQHLTHPAIMSVIHPQNAASRAVVLKFAAAYVDDVELAGRCFERYNWPGFVAGSGTQPS